MSIIEHKYADRESMLEDLYQVFIKDLQQQSPATLLLSGGSTPGPLYRKLSDARLDWANINVALVDERWVGTDHAASNERLLRETLLTNHAAEANFVGMKNGHQSPFDGQAGCSARYASLPRPYSICLLGMGPDGHTASLFPGAEGLDAAVDSKQFCAAIRAQQSEVTGNYVERMTMTPWSILQSRRLILLFTGDDKWRVYQQALQNGASSDLPVSLFVDQNVVPVDVFWAP